MKNTILCGLFLYPVICFCQKEFPIPLETIQADILLQEGSQNNIDSINWIREFSGWRRKDSFNFSPQYSDIIISSISEVCGKKFYLLEDSLILEALKNKIDENCKSQSYQKEIPLNDLKRHADAIKLTRTPKIEDQIWYPESRFIVNYYYNEQQPENTNKYVRFVNSISYDSSCQIIDGKSYSFKYIRSRDSIIDVFRSLKNNDFKFHLYLALIEKFVQLRCTEEDLLFIYLPIDEIFIRSGKYSPLQQAVLRIAIGKAFNTIRKNSEYAFISFRFAEYILINNKLYKYHEKIEPIIADFIAAKREERYLAYLRQTLRPLRSEEAYDRASGKRNYISLPEFFRRVLRIAHYETVIAFTEIRGTGTLTNRRLLIVAGVIHSLSKYLNDSEIKKNETFIRDFNILLCDYHRLVLQVERASQVQIQLILNTANSANNLISLKYYEDLKKLADIERDKGEINQAKNLYLIIEQFVNEKMDYYHSYQDYTFSFPSDPRLWKPDHFQMLIDSVGSLDTFHYGGYKQFLLNENLEKNFGLKSDQLLKILGEWAIKQKHWRDAAMLLSKVDRARIKVDDEESSRVFSAALFGEYVPEKYKSENTIRELYTYLILGGIVLAIISFLTGWAIRERKKAKVSEAKAQLLSHTMDQIGHLAPQCIRKIIKKHEGTIPQLIKSRLEKLSTLLDQLHFYSQEPTLTYEDEYNLACSYVDLSYTSTDKVSASDKICADYETDPTANFPTFVLFNAIQNAYKHGSVDNSDSAKVIVSVAKDGDKHTVTVTNPIYPDNITQEIEKRTGIKFMEAVLNGYNPKGKSNLIPKKVNSTFILTYSFTIKNR
ncbi:MAG: hypothetical protein F9K23_18740 [Bacteroidetes bacterium]|nr:MAG: hypothetical protein F9K23_18740 [Bacteroidota bacterium]